MKPEIALRHEFVENIPEALNEQTLYVSMIHGTVVHKCCCGCGREVVTPLSPAAWKLIFDGVSVSLYPSIGSWSLPCQSHYFITNNRVVWAARWSKAQVELGRRSEGLAQERYYASQEMEPSAVKASGKRESLWLKLKAMFRNRKTKQG